MLDLQVSSLAEDVAVNRAEKQIYNCNSL